MSSTKNPEISRAVRAVICENANPYRYNAKTIAAAMGLRDEYAAYELANPDSTRHVWAEDVISLFLCSGRDPRVFDEICRQVGAVFVDLDKFNHAQAEVPLATAMREASEFFAEAARDLEDGKITPLERVHLEREAREAIAAVVAFCARVGVAL